MRKRLCIFLIVATVLFCVACQTKPNKPISAVTVYYQSANIAYDSPNAVIAPCELDAAGHENDLEYLLRTYFAAMPSSGFAETFPKNTQLVSINLDGLTAKVVLCDDFAALTGVDLSIACACLTQTVISLTGCQEVIISAESAQLDGNNFITLSRDSYLLFDESGSDD